MFQVQMLYLTPGQRSINLSKFTSMSLFQCFSFYHRTSMLSSGLRSSLQSTTRIVRSAPLDQSTTAKCVNPMSLTGSVSSNWMASIFLGQNVQLLVQDQNLRCLTISLGLKMLILIDFLISSEFRNCLQKVSTFQKRLLSQFSSRLICLERASLSIGALIMATSSLRLFFLIDQQFPFFRASMVSLIQGFRSFDCMKVFSTKTISDYFLLNRLINYCSNRPQQVFKLFCAFQARLFSDYRLSLISLMHGPICTMLSSIQ